MTSTACSTPAFLITIDTEGDSVWERPRNVQTRNAEYLPRFQQLCETYKLKPTYLTNYEMACSPAFQDLARSCISRGTAEIGMHLHAWDSPPIQPLTEADHLHHPYLIDYPTSMMRDKIGFMTDLLEETFDVKVTSHRAGRWAFNETYAALLVERGYTVDCSVTPGHSWGRHPGAPGRFGTDYTDFPDRPYFLDAEDIRREGDTPLLEVPVTIRTSWLKQHWPGIYGSRVKSLARRIAAESQWLRPTGTNLASMLGLVTWAETGQRPYLEFMLHSSELMPGGSPTFPAAVSVERLYDDLDALFQVAARTFEGRTLSEFGARWQRLAR